MSLGLEIKTAGSAISSWGLFGVSLYQINEMLTTVALVLTIVTTGLTLVVWLRKGIEWVRDRASKT